MEKYRSIQPLQVKEGTIQKTATKTAKKVVSEWADKHLPVKVKTAFGEVTIDFKGINDSLSHGFGQKKLDAITSLPEGMKKAAFLGAIDDFQGKPLTNGYFCYPIEYKGERNVVFCRARRDVNINRLYIHEVYTEKEIMSIPLQTAAEFLNSKPHGGNALYKAILAGFFSHDKDKVDKGKENAYSYVIDEVTRELAESRPSRRCLRTS